MLQTLASERQSGCAHQCGEVSPGLFELFVYNNIVELGDVAYFGACGAQSPLDRLFGVLPATSQPALELRQARGGAAG